MTRFVLAVVFAGVSTATGAGIAMTPDGASRMTVVFLSLVIGAVAFTPIVRRVIRSDFNVFEPIAGGALMLGVLFCVRPLWVSSPSDSLYLGRDIQPYLPWALFVAAIGVSSFVVAYELISRRPLPRTDRAQQRFDLSTLTLLTILTATLSVVLCALYLAKAGSVVAGLRLLARGRSAEVGTVFGQSTQYLSAAPVLVASLVAVLLAVSAARRLSVAERVAYTIGLIYPAAYASFTGDRRFLIPCIAVPLATYYLARGRRVSRRTLVVVVPVVFILLSAIAFSRTIGAREQVGGQVNFFAESLQRPAEAWSRFIEGPDIDMIRLFALETSVLNNPGSFGYGRATVGDLAISPIPSVLFPAKPHSSHDVLLNRVFGVDRCDPLHGLCPDFSAVGSFYFDLWLPGVIFGMSLLGIGSAVVWRRYLTRRDPLSSFAVATWAVFLPILLRAGFMPGFLWFLIFLIPGVLILRLAAITASSTKHRASRLLPLDVTNAINPAERMQER